MMRITYPAIYCFYRKVAVVTSHGIDHRGIAYVSAISQNNITSVY